MRLIITLLLLISFKQSFSQTLFETRFKDNSGFVYQGFMVYYSEDNCYMRVGFTADDKYRVANISYKSITSVDNGINLLMLFGDSTYMVTQDVDVSYNPEHFVWVWTDDIQPAKPFYTTDPNFNEDSFKEVEYFTEIQLKDLSVDYLKQYYSTDEADFINFSNALLSPNKPIEQNLTTSKPTIHLIIAANTKIGDIGQSCIVDKRNVISEFEGVSEVLGVNLTQHIIEDAQFTKNNLINTLNSINSQPNDVIVFLYTGHGFRWSDQTDSYPNLDLRTSSYQAINSETSVSLSSVYNLLVGKGARLTLVLGDCCNSDVGVNQLSNSNYLANRANSNFDNQRLYDLFIKSKGSVISTAASPGEYSWSNAVNGGFFTDSFLQSLREEISPLNTKDVSWNTLIDNTVVKARYKTDKQNCKAQNGIKYLKVETVQ